MECKKQIHCSNIGPKYEIKCKINKYIYIYIYIFFFTRKTIVNINKQGKSKLSGQTLKY